MAVLEGGGEEIGSFLRSYSRLELSGERMDWLTIFGGRDSICSVSWMGIDSVSWMG